MKRGLVGIVGGLVIGLVFAASASANTYCVPTGGGAGCTNAGALDLQAALTSAAAISGPDTVRVAAGTLAPSNCTSAGFMCNSPDSLTLVGAGALTELTCTANYNASLPFKSILDVTGPVTVSETSPSTSHPGSTDEACRWPAARRRAT